MNKYAYLTEVDHMILESYKSVIDGLAEYLGPGYEFVLHSLEDLDRAAIKVVNGHYTGRKEGAPITDLAMKMLSEINKSGNNHTNLVYFNSSKKGTPIRAATLPITGQNDRIIGLLCVNLYMDISLHTFLESMMKIENGNKSENIVETYASNSDELVLSSIESARIEVINNPNITAPNRNKEIIAILHQKGVFLLKDAVIQVASILGISKNTVYLHLRNMSAKRNDDIISDEIPGEDGI